MCTEDEKKAFDEILSLGFVDAYRMLNPKGREYTWWPYAFQAHECNIGWRIDYVLVSCQNRAIKDIEICSDIHGSDHCPIRIDFDA